MPKAATLPRSPRGWKYGPCLTTQVAAMLSITEKNGGLRYRARLSMIGVALVVASCGNANDRPSSQSVVIPATSSASPSSTASPSSSAPLPQVPDTGTVTVARASPSPVGTSASSVAPMVAAFDIGTGATRWTIPMSDKLRGISDLAVDESHVFAQSGFCDNNVVAALDPTTGATTWRTAPELQIIEGNVTGRSHVLAESGILLMEELAPEPQATVALDTNTGQAKWTNEGQILAESPTVVVLLTQPPGTVTVLDRVTGNELWSTQTSVGVTVGADADTVYLRTDDHVTAADAATGTVRWTAPAAPMNDPAQLLAGDGVVVTESKDGGVVALKTADGSEAWTEPNTTGAERLSLSDAWLADGNLYLSEGQLSVLDLTTGKRRWQVPTDLGQISVLGANGGRVLASGSGGQLHLLDAATGTELWDDAAAAGAEAVPGTYELGQDAVYVGVKCGGND